MRTKNHVKSPKKDSLRGIGKLGWSGGGKMHSTIKRLVGSFQEVKKCRSRKNKYNVSCEVCGKLFKVNNVGKVPSHTRYTSQICRGSWVKQSSDKYTVECLESVSSAIGIINVGDILLVDFSRTILQELYNGFRDIIELQISRIEMVCLLCNDGSVYSRRELIYFKDLPTPIPNSISIIRHCIKI